MVNLACVALALLVPQATEAALQRKVSVMHVATRLERLMPVLAKELAIPVKVDVRLQDVPLILSVHDRPVQEVLDKIAAAVVASWKKVDGAYILMRDDRLEEKLSAEAKRVRAAKLQRSIDAHLKKIEAVPWDEASLRKMAEASLAQYQSALAGKAPRLRENHELSRPAERLFARLVHSIGAERLLALKRFERVVFATNPTAKQLPFGPSAGDAWERFLTEVAALDKASADLRLRLDPEIPSNAPGLETLKVDDIAKVVLDVVVEEQWKADRWEVRIQGVLINNQGDWITAEYVAVPEWTGDPLRRDSLPKGDATDELTSNPMADYSMRIYHWMQAMQPGPEPSMGEARKALLEPEQIDPLSHTASTALIEIASMDELCLAAVVPDDLALSDLTLFRSGAAHAETFLALMRQTPNVVEDADDTWWVIKPDDPIRDRLDRGDRTLMGWTIRSIVENPRPYLRELLVCSQASHGTHHLTVSAIHLAVPQSLFWAGTQTQRDIAPLAWALASNLTDDNFRRLVGGESIGIEDLSEPASAALDAYIFGFRETLKSRDDASHPAKSWWNDPTEAFAAGLPHTVRIRFRTEPLPFAKSANPNGPGSRRTLSAYHLGRMMAAREKPQLAQARYPEWTDAFLVPTGWQYVFEVEISPGVVLTQTLDDPGPFDPRPRKFDELPERLRLKAKEYYDGFMQSTGGGNQ